MDRTSSFVLFEQIELFTKCYRGRKYRPQSIIQHAGSMVEAQVITANAECEVLSAIDDGADARR